MRPQRIVSLLAGGTEILYAVEAGGEVVGVSHECDFPGEVACKPRLTRANVDATQSSAAIDRQVRAMTREGRAMYAVDAQQLAALRPDVIVTQSHCDVCAVSLRDVQRAVSQCPQLGDANIVAINPSSLDAVFGDIRRVGVAVDRKPQADSLMASLRNRIESVRAKTTGRSASDRPRVACIEWTDPVMLAANWMPELIDLAGGQCSLTAAGTASTYAVWEEVVTYDPQVIIVAACGFDHARTLREISGLSGLSGWNDISAVRNGRVFAADGNAYFNRSGPRLVDTLEILAQVIHPERFKRTFGRNVWSVAPAGG